MNRLIRPLIAIIGDTIIFYGSLWITLIIRYGDRFNYDLFNKHILPFSYILAIWLLIFYVSGLYDRRLATQRFVILNMVVHAMTFAGILGATFFYVTTGVFFTIKPIVVFLLQIFIFGVIFLGWRYLIYVVGKKEGLAQKILFVGNDKLITEITKELQNKPELGLRIINSDNTTNYKNFCLKNSIDTIVVSSTSLKNPEVVSKLYECLPLQIRFIDLPTFYEDVSGKIPIDAIEQSWFLEKISLHKRNIYDVVKRIVDIILAIIFGLLTILLMPFVAIAIKLESKGPIFYSQTRVGERGVIFKINKFRTMVKDAEKTGNPVWSKSGDSRITKVGSFLRKTRIDELPQVWNVLKGDLSFVGPRPERPEFVKDLTTKIPFYNERHLVKPGLAGWAQISLPYDASEQYTREKLQYDLYYIKNRNLLLDFGIVLKTIKSVLTRSGR